MRLRVEQSRTAEYTHITSSTLESCESGWYADERATQLTDGWVQTAQVLFPL